MLLSMNSFSNASWLSLMTLCIFFNITFLILQIFQSLWKSCNFSGYWASSSRKYPLSLSLSPLWYVWYSSHLKIEEILYYKEYLYYDLYHFFQKDVWSGHFLLKITIRKLFRQIFPELVNYSARFSLVGRIARKFYFAIL